MNLMPKIKFSVIIVMILNLIITASFSNYSYANPNISWEQSISPLLREKSPTAQKLHIWLNVTNDKKTYSTEELIKFVFENGNWPMLHKFREQVEKDIEFNVKPNGIRLWFDLEAPKSYSGINAYLEALTKLNRLVEVRDNAKKIWINAQLKNDETIEFYKNYKQYLTNDDIKNRLNFLLWNNRYYEAGYMFPLISESDKKIARARMALGRDSYRSDELVKALSDNEKADAGIIYERAKWRRRKNKNDSAIEMLKLQPHHPEYSDSWWRERNILARRKIEEKKFQEAYNLITEHKVHNADSSYSQAEWLLGWLSLSFLNQPKQAYMHFENFYNSVSAAISSSRAAYWLGRADEALGNTNSARNWYRLASQFPSTFYGQLATEKLGKKISKSNFLSDRVSEIEQSNFNNNELVIAIRLLYKHKLQRHSKSLFIKLLQEAKTRSDYILIANLAQELGNNYYVVEANKRIQQYLGDFMFDIGYPTIKLPRAVVNSDASLIHALIYRESMFDTHAVSHAGARGLMQLMPRTAKAVSKQKNLTYNIHKLTNNQDYNIQLGATYINDLLKRYNDNYPLALASYNAGRGNVSKWIKTFGSPKENNIDIVDWIELIPIYETRNYVQRVMETYYIYNLKLGEEPKTIYSLLGN